LPIPGRSGETNMNQLKSLFMAHFKMTFREKQVWFWSIFYPVLLLVIFLTIFGRMGSSSGEDFNAKIAVVSTGSSEVSQRLEHTLKAIPALEWKEDKTVDKDQAEEWLRNKKIDAVIVIPDGENTKQVELLVNRENELSITSQALAGILREILGGLERTAPLEYSLAVSSISSGNEDLSYTDFLLTGMIALAISQAGLFGMVSLVEMRRNGLLKRLKLTPVNMRLFGFSEMLVRIILSTIQVLLLSLIGLFFYGAHFDIHIAAFTLMFIVGTLSFTAMGFMIASFSKSMESFMGIVNLVSFLMMFLSGVFFKFSSLPEWLQPVASALPLTFFVNGIRDGMVYGIGIMNTTFWMNIGVLFAWMVVTFAIGSRFYKWTPDVK